jgi:hypothetical protein
MSGIMNMFVAAKTTIATAVDAFFNLTTLLLNTSSTNGAQNNTFLDSSTNNFTITRNGNTTQGTFTPFSQTGWSNYFNGSSDYLSIANNANLNLGSSNFTIEFWVYAPSSTSPNGIISKGNTTSLGSEAWSVEWTNTTGTLGYGSGAFNGWASPIVTGTVTLNAWNHVAVVRNGTTHTLYINGTSASTATASYTVTSAGSLYIGTGWYAPGSRYFVGYISNARIVIGSAVYTSAFTPSTTPLTAITNTQLLTCQDNRFKDNSTNAFAITITGTPSVQAFSPFLPTAAYDAAVVGGSGYFDGTGDYLATSGANAALGAGTFTIDGWFYSTGYNSGEAIYSGLNTYPANTGLLFYINGSGTYTVDVNGTNVISAGTAPLNAWTHFALVRSSTGTNGLALYINGVSIATGTTANNFTSTDAVIGRTGASAASNLWLGYLSGIRIVVGSANVPSGVPTAPPTAITNTQLLLNATNSGIFDSTAKNDLETVGNAQVSTTQAKWGTTSLYCPATNGNYFVSPPNQQNLIFNSGNFTVEAWIYPTAFTNTATGLIGYGLSGGYVDWNLEISTSGAVLYIDNDGGRFTSSSNLSTNVWTHIAIARTNTAVTMYFNGTSVGSYSTINNISGSSTSARLYVGTGAQSPGARQFIGYIDDPRITKGYARYTANFTPPAAALPTQ